MTKICKTVLLLLSITLLLGMITGCAAEKAKLDQQPGQNDPPPPQIKSAARNLFANAIITYNTPDNGRYITRHQYKINTAADTMTISSLEPGGNVKWQLSGGGLSITHGSETIDRLDYHLYSYGSAKGILMLLTANMPDFEPGIEPVDQSVSLNGKWYELYPISENITLYKDIDLKRFDTAIIDDNKGQVTVNCYNYRWAEGIQNPLPTKFDIFEKTGSFNKRLSMQVQFDGLRPLKTVDSKDENPE